MKKYSFVAALLAGLVTSVTAAQAQSPTVNWTGFYIGGHGGYQWSTIDLGFENELPGLGDGVSLDTDGGMGGMHGGVQQQFGNWVLGVELSGDWGNGEGSAYGAWGPVGAINCPFGCFGFEAQGAESVQVELNNLFLATA
jgi:opacity protein-like surface antigen